MGIRDAIGDRWARFRAYLHSIPPHVWLGLLIGAIALVLAYLAWKNRNNALSPLSSLSDTSPLTDTTTTTTTPGTPPNTNQIPLPAVPDLGNLVYPQGLYYNYNTQKPVKAVVHDPTPTPVQQVVDIIFQRSPTAYTAPNNPTPTERGTNIGLGAPPVTLPDYNIQAVVNAVANASKSATALPDNNIRAVTSAVTNASQPAPALPDNNIRAVTSAVTNASHAVITQAKVPIAAPKRPATAYVAPKLPATPTGRGTNIAF